MAWDEVRALVAALVWDEAILILSVASLPGYRVAGGRMAAVTLPLSHRRRLTAQPAITATRSHIPGGRHYQKECSEEVINMPYGYGYGRGFGFRGTSPPWPYVGRGRGGMPRCWYPGAYGAPTYTPPPPPPYYGDVRGAPYPQMSQKDELEFLKEEANAVKTHLDEIEARIKELEKEEN